MDIPGDLKFAPSHEWVRIEDDGTLTIGISGHAQEQLGDLVFVETPEIDLVCDAEEGVAVVESVKAASDIYAPVAGKITDANPELSDNPELVNSDPYQAGWLFRMEPDDVADVEKLMDPEAYSAYVEAED